MPLMLVQTTSGPKRFFIQLRLLNKRWCYSPNKIFSIQNPNPNFAATWFLLVAGWKNKTTIWKLS